MYLVNPITAMHVIPHLLNAIIVIMVMELPQQDNAISVQIPIVWSVGLEYLYVAFANQDILTIIQPASHVQSTIAQIVTMIFWFVLLASMVMV